MGDYRPTFSKYFAGKIFRETTMIKIVGLKNKKNSLLNKEFSGVKPNPLDGGTEVMKMEIRKMTDTEVEEELRKAGGYWEYRKKVLSACDEPEPAPKPIAKSESQVASDYYIAIAKVRGISLEQFFRGNPDEYQRYKKLVTSRDY